MSGSVRKNIPSRPWQKHLHEANYCIINTKVELRTQARIAEH